MKRYLPISVLVLGLAYLGSTLVPPRTKSEFDLRGFGRLPVRADGRIKPLDTVARTSLLVLQGRQRFVAPDGASLQPVEWLLEVFFNPAVADDYQHFLIENPEALALFGKEPGDQKRFSLNELRGGLAELERQMRLADPVEEQVRTPFQREVAKLYQRVVLYQRLKASVNLEDSPDLLAEVLRLQQTLPGCMAALRAKQSGQPYDEQNYQIATAFLTRFQFMSASGYLLVIPPDLGDPDPNGWRKTGDTLAGSFVRGAVNPDAMAYAGLGHAWRLKQPQDFNEVVRLLTAQLTTRFGPQLQKCRAETAFNQAEPFYTSMGLYVFAFLLAVGSWLKWPDGLQRSAFWLLGLAFSVATVGIVTRMWLEGRPPVTNLYSSALFVGWVAVALCLVLEKIYRNAIGATAGGMIGFCTLIIAHHLSLNGDTMEMMRAVLDSNFWLATHVVVITMGYGSTFLAGILAIIYIFRGALTKSLTKETAAALTRMVYGIVCFATLFSLVGTVLGGIWADQSWGRFWGWDPKENGALIIVLWNAIILHCRWGGLVKQRGLMMLAVFGNVVTSWSWFGVNMLGVGLHSYGFMQSAFYWLVGFVVSQLLIIGLAALPPEKWRSFQKPPTASPPVAGRKAGSAAA
jgi:ABC-type transport system involved in cytochrome c biogenesis permease subunit